jgi:hypothetical protein
MYVLALMPCLACSAATVPQAAAAAAAAAASTPSKSRRRWQVQIKVPEAVLQCHQPPASRTPAPKAT